MVVLTFSQGQSLAHFLGATLIQTERGEVPVHALAEGDTLLTADGGTTRVKQVSRQDVPAINTDATQVNPICFLAGSLGSNVPSHELFVSPENIMEVDGLQVKAGALVNGSSIFQVEEMPSKGFSYFQVETQSEDLLLAENAPIRMLPHAAVERSDGQSFVKHSSQLPEATRVRLEQRADLLQTRFRKSA